MKTRQKQLEQNELAISLVLRYGVIACMLVLAFGLSERFLHPGAGGLSSGEVVRGLMSGSTLAEPFPAGAALRGLTAVFRAPADSWMALGLALLIALPIARVGLTVGLFAQERDWIFFGITLVVFLILLFSVIFGRAL